MDYSKYNNFVNNQWEIDIFIFVIYSFFPPHLKFLCFPLCLTVFSIPEVEQYITWSSPVSYIIIRVHEASTLSVSNPKNNGYRPSTTATLHQKQTPGIYYEMCRYYRTIAPRRRQIQKLWRCGKDLWPILNMYKLIRTDVYLIYTQKSSKLTHLRKRVRERVDLVIFEPAQIHTLIFQVKDWNNLLRYFLIQYVSS